MLPGLAAVLLIAALSLAAVTLNPRLTNNVENAAFRAEMVGVVLRQVGEWLQETFGGE